MKKLMLDLTQLQVSSLVLDEADGGVHSREAATLAATCSCYPSMNCSGPGCVQTYWNTCMTNNNSQC